MSLVDGLNATFGVIAGNFKDTWSRLTVAETTVRNVETGLATTDANVSTLSGTVAAVQSGLGTTNGNLDNLFGRVNGHDTAIVTTGERVDGHDSELESLGSRVSIIDTSLAAKVDLTALATVATTGAYSDLTGRPTIPTVPVQSVAGKTGAVTLVKGDVGLGLVDNTSDASKPVSTAVQTALDGKSATTHGHALTDAVVTGILSVAKGGTGRITATTPYGIIAAGTTATGIQQTIAPGGAGQALVSKGGSALAAFETLTKTSVGLPNVDNTSDLTKPISAPTQAYIDARGFLIEVSGVYPARPDSKPVVFVGPTNPGAAMLDGDTWISTGPEGASPEPNRFLIEENGVYPTRPDNDPVIYVGDTSPESVMLIGDTWIDTSDTVAAPAVPTWRMMTLDAAWTADAAYGTPRLSYWEGRGLLAGNRVVPKASFDAVVGGDRTIASADAAYPGTLPVGNFFTQALGYTGTGGMFVAPLYLTTGGLLVWRPASAVSMTTSGFITIPHADYWAPGPA